MIILSFDCAYRSLAWAYINFSPISEIIADTKKCMKDAIAGDTFAPPPMIQLLAGGVDDILGRPVASVDHVGRARKLHQHLVDLDSRHPTPDLVLIEHQPMRMGMASNAHSSVVQQQILFHYIAAGIAVEFIDPKQKNNIDLSIPMSALMENAVSSQAKYRARKKHSIANFDIIAAVFDMKIAVPAKHKDDIADAIMQALVYWGRYLATTAAA